MIDPGNKEISIERQCGLVGLSRAGYYYEPKEESPENLAIMRWIDEKYTDHPFYGVLRMTEWLRRDKKYAVNPKRVRRLMKLMGLDAIYPKPRLSEPGQGHKVYPYLLRNVTVTRPNHVWSVDITYIRLRGGFIYLVAIIDWFSRFVVSWEISNSLESDFCISALNRALIKAKPEIFNSDQGVQFTSQAFTSVLKEHQISISMDGRGRALDNVFVERLWRSVKYEEVYLNDYESTEQAVSRLRGYFQFYNHERRHQSLGYETPVAVYQSTREIASAAQPVNGLRPPSELWTACSLRLSGG